MYIYSTFVWAFVCICFLYRTSLFVNCIMSMYSGPEAAYYQINKSISHYAKFSVGTTCRSHVFLRIKTPMKGQLYSYLHTHQMHAACKQASSLTTFLIETSVVGIFATKNIIRLEVAHTTSCLPVWSSTDWAMLLTQVCKP